MHVDEHALAWVYPCTATLGLALALLLPSAVKRVRPAQRWTYVYLQAITLAGAVIGAKVALLAGDLGWPREHVTLEQVVFSGKSLVGGLLGGFLFAEVAKPFFDYREPPNDWFATKLVLSIAVGRLGCLCAGCCRGIPWDSPLAIAYSDNVPRVPIAVLELTFHLALFAAFALAHHRGKLEGRIFALYAILYGSFRIALEPLRETPKLASGISVYQLLCAALIAAGAVSLLRRPTPASVARA